MTKDEIKMTREQHKKMREKSGYKYRFYVDEPKPYNHYNFLKRLSKLQKRGDKRDVRKS